MFRNASPARSGSCVNWVWQDQGEEYFTVRELFGVCTEASKGLGDNSRKLKIVLLNT
jgi:hypothetical protein